MFNSTNHHDRAFGFIFDRVLLEKIKPVSRSPGGILLPETAMANNEFKVVAVGSGRVLADGKMLPPAVKVGDTVVNFPVGG